MTRIGLKDPIEVKGDTAIRVRITLMEQNGTKVRMATADTEYGALLCDDLKLSSQFAVTCRRR